MKDMREVQRREVHAIIGYEVMEALAAVKVEKLV